MSTHYYGVDDYGLVLDANALNLIAAKLFDDYTDEAWDEDKYEFIESVAEKLDLGYASNFTGELYRIRDDGYTEWGYEEPYEDDCVYYVPLSNYPTLFNTSYKNMDEIVEEMKQKVGQYLPDTFPYSQQIRHIVGSCYG